MNGSKLRGPPRHMLRDTLTVELVTPGPVDPLTGAGTGETVATVISQPCSDQDVPLKERTRYIVDGVNGVMPTTRCFTRWFAWPTPAEGQTVVVRVNGRVRSLLRQGPPEDTGGQQGVSVLYLSEPVN